MQPTRQLADGFGRVREHVTQVLEGLHPEVLTARVDPEANSIAWLVWHLTRVQDDHLAAAAEALGHPDGGRQVWVEEGFASRFGLPFDDSATGYGHSPAEVAQVVVESGALLRDYHEAVHARSVSFLSRLEEDDLDVVVDRRWDPPVTLGVRLVSVLDDTTQHAGQAAFVRGVLERRAAAMT